MRNVDDPNERRRFQRFLFDAPVVIQGGRNSRRSKLLDVSLNGALVAEPPGWSPGPSGEYRIQIQLSEDTVIDMLATVSHEERGHIGFQCQHIDMDSISHLRRLVELNLGDPALLERELDALG